MKRAGSENNEDVGLSLGDDEYCPSEMPRYSMTRKKTIIERDVQSRKERAAEFVRALPPEISVKEYLPSQLSGALFCGHLMTDMDSIAGAIGAAELYGGIPARASEVNSETSFALQQWHAPKPKPIEELLEEYPKAGVCLVDHQQTSQLNKSIDVSILSLCIFSVSLNFKMG
jgi:manganese-dependent inorganic pyrophosphatase